MCLCEVKVVNNLLGACDGCKGRAPIGACFCVSADAWWVATAGGRQLWQALRSPDLKLVTMGAVYGHACTPVAAPLAVQL